MSNDTAEKTVADVISKVGLWWPAADEDELREAASLWRTFAGEVDGVAADGSSAARDLVGTNTGPGVDAFDTFWARYDGGSQAYLPAIASSARDMATALDDFATAVVGAKDRVRELAVEIGATLVVGTVLAFFTFGAAEAAAAGITAGLISAAAAIGVELGATAATIAGAVVAGAAFGAVESAAVDVAVAQPIRVEVFHDGGFSLGEVEQSFAVGGALGGLLGGAGSGIRAIRRAPVPPRPRWSHPDDRPPGVPDDWLVSPANNGRGYNWQDPTVPPGKSNANLFRVQDPSARYPYGCVRFYNKGNQPVGPDGNPGPNDWTHIPINPDGTYPIPKGWPS